MLHIIVQYYNDSNPERQAEVDDACFRRNLDCPWVTQLHNLVEPYTVVPEQWNSIRNMSNAVSMGG